MKKGCFSKIMITVILILSLSLTAACGNPANQENAANQSQTDERTGETGEANQGNPGQKVPKAGGNVVVVVPQDPDFLDPHLAVASGTSEIMFNVFEGLLKPDKNGNLYPAVAENYEVSEDGLTYTFEIREGIKFHNGKTVTPEDVKYSIERLMGAETGKPLSSAFANVERVEILDQKTVAIKIKEYDASFLSNLTAAILPKDNADHNANPIGTGPFKFVEYLPEQRLVIEKFDGYWQKGVPYLDRVEFRMIPDNEAALLSFKAGEIDIYPRIDNERLAELGPGFHDIQGMQNMVQLMAMNMAKEPFKDIRVRQAINYAVDVDEIIEAVAHGYGTKLGSNMSPVMAKYYQDGLQDTYNLDVVKAKQLLKEAGYEKGFKTKISVPSNYQFHVDTAQVIANQLKKVGIEAEIEMVEWGVWLDRVYKGRDYELTIIGLTGKLDPHQVLVRYKSDNPGNFFNYNNPAYDSLMEEAAREIDDNKRAEIYKEAQKKLVEDAAAVYIMDPNYTVAMKSNLDGYTLYPLYVQDMSTIYYTE